MTRNQFCTCAKTLREYGLWERKLYDCGFDLTGTPASDLAENLHAIMCNFNPNWAYDTKLGFDWIIEWSCGESDAYWQERHGRSFDIDDAGALYDFLVFMNEHGWED